MSKIRVLFLSVQPVVLAALMSFFLNDSLITIDFDDYTNFLKIENVQNKKHQVIVFDDGSLGQSEYEKLNRYLFNDKFAKKILYTGSTDKCYLNFFVDCNMDSIVSKRADLKILSNAILNVANNKSYFCKHIRALISKGEIDPTEILSPKEKEVLLLIAEGLKNKEIAEKLYASSRTIETHKTHMVKKLGLKNTTELLCYGVKNIERLKI